MIMKQFTEIAGTQVPVAVVGGGIAGYSAALTLKNLNVPHVWLGTNAFGEKLPAAEWVRNYPAFSGNGAEFLQRLSEQAESEGVVLTQARIDGIYAGDGFLLAQNGETVTAKAVILATGVELKASVAGERGFFGRGVSYCAVCDGGLYRGKDVAVFLYSDRFAEETEYLAGIASSVSVFCIGCKPQFHSDRIRVIEGKPTEIVGDDRVRAVRYTGGEIGTSAVFCLKNSTPPSVLVGGLATENGFVVTDRNMETNLSGLFAAGDVTGTPFQFAKAVGEGLIAAYSASKYIKSQK